MIKTLLSQALTQALAQAFPPHLLDASTLKWERPRQVDHGDFAINMASLSKVLRQAPPQVVTAILPYMTGAWQCNAIGAFLNLKLSDELLAQALLEILQAPQPGRTTAYDESFISLEFVSANPTGPLHIGHGRWAALGDSIRRIMEHCGARIRADFYINDAGAQMNNLARSLWVRCWQQLDVSVVFPEKPGNSELPYPYYLGEYVIPLAQQFLSTHPHAFKEKPKQPDEADPLFHQLRQFGRDTLLKSQQDTLNTLRVRFDYWLSESELYAQGQVEAVLKQLETTNATYELDSALWLKTTNYGDEKDRVLRKQDGSYTYLLPDIACHIAKVKDPEITGMIDIWGADHHGYIPRMQAALEIIGMPPGKLRIILGQLVNLIIAGEKTRMGKRRTMLTLDDLVEEAGVDATRFWMVSKSPDVTLDFDVDLAASQSDENPVFYVQYAHARCAGIIRNATQPILNLETGQTQVAWLTPEDWESWLKQADASNLQGLFTGLGDNERAKQTATTLLLRLDGFQELVFDAGRLRAPHLLARYAQDLAAEFHSFYNACRILTGEVDAMRPRLALVVAVKRVLATVLDLLGVSAPEQM